MRALPDPLPDPLPDQASLPPRADSQEVRSRSAFAAVVNVGMKRERGVLTDAALRSTNSTPTSSAAHERAAQRRRIDWAAEGAEDATRGRQAALLAAFEEASREALFSTPQRTALVAATAARLSDAKWPAEQSHGRRVSSRVNPMNGNALLRAGRAFEAALQGAWDDMRRARCDLSASDAYNVSALHTTDTTVLAMHVKTPAPAVETFAATSAPTMAVVVSHPSPAVLTCLAACSPIPHVNDDDGDVCGRLCMLRRQVTDPRVGDGSSPTLFGSPSQQLVHHGGGVVETDSMRNLIHVFEGVTVE